MKRLLLASAAAAALALGMPAAQAQRAQDDMRNAPAAGASQQQTSPRASDRGREHAAPRQERSSSQAGRPQGGASADNPARAGNEGRDRGTSGARAQDRANDRANDRAQDRAQDRAKDDDAMRGRSERSKASERAGGRSNEQARDRGDRRQRNEARDDRRDRADQDRGRMSRDQADRNRDRERSTTGQSTGERANDSRRANDTARSDRNRDRDRDRADRGPDARGSVQLSQEQRTRISTRFSDRIERLNVRVLPRSRLSVSVGLVVPSSIRLYDVPADIVAIHPGFRGYKFVVVEDEIVIIEPRSRKVVTTISRSGERSASRSTTGAAASGSHLRLRAHDRDVIRTVVMRQPECRYETRIDFRIGLPLPRTVQICEFPDEVLAEVPEIRQYRYVVHGDDIALIDPDAHRIVEVIE
jgi:hypothetical protein